MAGGAVTRYVAVVGGRPRRVEIDGGAGRYRVSVDGEVWDVDARRAGDGLYSILVEGAAYTADVADGAAHTTVDVDGETHAVQVEEASRYGIRTRGGAAGAGNAQTLAAPLPGRVTHLPVAVGDVVAPGDTLAVIEAMKMENELKAGAAGTVREVRVRVGQAVNAGDVLLVVG
jgi:biotin carboxyl carrier protein